MNLLRQTLLVSLLFGVSLFSATVAAAWFENDDTISLVEPKKSSPAVSPTQKNAVTVRMMGYVDARKDMGAKKIGVTNQRIGGIWGKELLIDREVAQFVAESIKQKFNEGGFQLVEGEGALYELSGVVKDLTYNVGVKDEISILLETTLKEVASGKVIWSGAVVEKPKGRFAGVSGNSKVDVANYLKREVGIVTQKTYEAINNTLIALRPDLFNMTPGTQPIAGVTVLQAAGSNAPMVKAGDRPTTAGMNGVLVLSTKPTRAKVYVDGIYFGMSPLRSEIEVGVHEISVKLDKHKTSTEKVSIRNGATTELELTLER